MRGKGGVDRLLKGCVESGHVFLIPIWEVSVESLGISCSYEVDVPFGVSRVLVSLFPRGGALEFELVLGDLHNVHAVVGSIS